MKHNFNVFAVTAPHWVELPQQEQSSLNSSDPFSLQNAIRYSVKQSRNIDDIWNQTNWKSETGLKESVYMYQYFNNQKSEFINKIKTIEPDILIISSMTLGYRGAIEIAKIAREYNNNKDFLIVLGGKHIIETTYLLNNKIVENEDSPLKHMRDGLIPPLFDLVISGDGEDIIYQIGALLSKTSTPLNRENFFNKISYLNIAKGNWLLGYLYKSKIKYLESKNTPLNQDILPFPIELFEPTSNFPVLDSDRTFHAYSYMSKGCPFDCFFCSEKRSINGKLSQTSTAALRLLKQLKISKKYGEKNNLDISAFVEDSILLGGKLSALEEFSNILNNNSVKFGAQYTIDLILNPKHQKILKKLSKQGLIYLFIGVETNVEGIANSMSKNSNKKITWNSKVIEVIKFLKSINIKCGFSLLFGLGESFNDRINLMDQIYYFQQTYNMPNVVSLNLATIHPLRNDNKIDFIKWGTSQTSKYLPIFTKIFGEASYEYSLNKDFIGELEELDKIQIAYERINKEQ